VAHASIGGKFSLSSTHGSHYDFSMEANGRELTIELENVLGPGSVLSSPDQIAPFIREPRGVYNRPAAGVVLPADVNEVAQVVRWAN